MNKDNDNIVSMDYEGNVYYGNNHGRIDMDGRPVERTKEKFPYSYDAYVTWKGDYSKYKGDCVYSDRLLHWDWDKYNECVMEVWGNKGQIFYNRTPKDIEKFLSLYYDKEVKLTMIMEGCNTSNGFPYWIFMFEDKEEKK